MGNISQNATIVRILDNKSFQVILDTDNTQELVLGYLSFTMYRNRIPISLGDRVKIYINGSDSKKGKIFYKFPIPSESKKYSRVSKKTRLEKSPNDPKAMQNSTSTESLLNKESKKK